MFGFMSKKDRTIKNLEAKVKNRDILIEKLECDKRTYKARIKELEAAENNYINNIEILISNLTAAKKKQLGL